MIEYNVDRLDAAKYTKAPFTTASTMQIGSVEMPAFGITSLRIQCTEDVAPPVFLHSITAYDEDGRGQAVFADSKLALVCTWELVGDDGATDQAAPGSSTAAEFSTDYRTAFLRGSNGVLAGTVTYARYLPDMLIGAARAGNDSVIKLGTGALVVLPQCLQASLAGHARSITINGISTTADTTITPSSYTHASYRNSYANKELCEKSYIIGLTGPFAPIVQNNGISYLDISETSKLNGETMQPSSAGTRVVPVAGKHIIIRSTVESNARLVTDNKLGVNGVID